MADKKIRLRIVTPTRELYDKPVDMVIMRTTDGDTGILHGHQPMTTILDYGILRIFESDDNEIQATVFGGFANVQPEMMTIISDASEWPGEIDAERAYRAKQRAEERILHKQSKINVARAELAVRRALIRLEAKDHVLKR